MSNRPDDLERVKEKMKHIEFTEEHKADVQKLYSSNEFTQNVGLIIAGVPWKVVWGNDLPLRDAQKTAFLIAYGEATAGRRFDWAMFDWARQ